MFLVVFGENMQDPAENFGRGNQGKVIEVTQPMGQQGNYLEISMIFFFVICTSSFSSQCKRRSAKNQQSCLPSVFASVL